MGPFQCLDLLGLLKISKSEISECARFRDSTYWSTAKYYWLTIGSLPSTIGSLLDHYCWLTIGSLAQYRASTHSVLGASQAAASESESESYGSESESISVLARSEIEEMALDLIDTKWEEQIKVLEEIECNNFRDIVSDLTNDGKINV